MIVILTVQGVRLMSNATALLLSDGQTSIELTLINKGLLEYVKYSTDTWMSFSLMYPYFKNQYF